MIYTKPSDNDGYDLPAPSLGVRTDSSTPCDLNRPPMDGEEYLRQVMQQAQTLPDMMIAEHIDPGRFESQQTNYMPSFPDISVAPPGLQPSDEWAEGLWYGFDNFREELAYAAEQNRNVVPIELPQLSDTAGWRILFVGATSESSEAGAQSCVDFVAAAAEDEVSPCVSLHQSLTPSFNLISQISPGCAAKLVQHSGLWLVSQMEDPELRRRRCIATISQHTTPSLCAHSAQWIFALLSRIDWLLDAAIQGSLRQILRFACQMRAGLPAKDATPEQDGCEPDDLIAHLNIVITIVGYYFGQAEGYETQHETE